MVMPRRWNTVGQWATAAPESFSISKSFAIGQLALAWSLRKMPWPMIRLSSSTPSEFSHSIGVMPWRRVISWNSTTLCAAWSVIFRPRFFASAAEAWISSGVQVSIWLGETMPERRPEGWATALSITPIASSMAFSPAASSHSYSVTWPFLVYQRAERYMGAA